MASEKRILVAEDDLATSQAWSELIAAWGFRVEVAEDGKRARAMSHRFFCSTYGCRKKTAFKSLASSGRKGSKFQP
jgi:hypothetical protein